MANSATLSYRPDIQGLRAIAITLVVLAHAGVSAFPGGFVGVDVFFVLSGYLITGLLVREHASTGRIRLAAFIARRLKRLLPALLVMLVLVILIATALLSHYEVREQSASMVYAATWTSNLFFALSTLDYFSELQTRDLFLHTWSLGVEEQFYVIWPLLLLVTLAVLTRTLGRDGHHRQLIMVLGLLFAGSLVLSLYWAATLPLWSFYLMPSRIWQFALGAVVFAWFHGRSRVSGDISAPDSSRLWSKASGVIGLFLIIGSALLLHPNLTYPGFWALIPSAGAALVIAAGHQSESRSNGTGSLLAHPALVWVGDRSYSWYLWHWPVLMLGFAWGMQNRLVESTGLVALSLSLAILSYRWVEQPFWKGRLSQAAPARIIMLSVLAMLMVISSGQHYMRQSTENHQVENAPIAKDARSDIPVIYAHGCDTWHNSSDIQPCILGQPDASRTVVLIGDSIGAQWFSLLPGIFRSPEWRVVILTKSACAMVDEDYFYDRIGKIYTVCTDWRNAALDYLSALGPDLVFLGSASTYDFTETQWVDGSSRVLARLTEVAGQVIVIPGTPKMSFDGPGCLARRVQRATEPFDVLPACQESLTSTRDTDVARHLKLATERFPNVRLLNLNDLVCPNRQCSALNQDGVVVFRDNKHLTDSFVRAQIPGVLSRLERVGVTP
jgi:peptidoglycan/LPS O-acetylase OafA/YrhL